MIWKIYWKLEIIDVLPSKEQYWKKWRMFKVKCECWEIKEIKAIRLNSWTKSCWCLQIEKSKQRKKHWMVNTRFYRIWSWIKARCEKEKASWYKNYWWRWIKCEWNSFEEFYKDMYNTYKDNLTIDRIDNNWNYSKENCRWVTLQKQLDNRRNTIRIEYKWEKLMIKEWSKKLWISKHTIIARMNNKNLTIEQILFKWHLKRFNFLTN